jgi:small subunit ribosomal protein S18
MSDQTTPTPVEPAPIDASNSGGQDQGVRRVLKDKDAGLPPGSVEPKFRGRRRRKVSYLTINKIETVDYKEVNILRRFINDRGKILSSRQTGNTAKQQRMIASAIRRAREMALLPFVVREHPGERGPRPRPPREDRWERTPRREAEPRPEAGARQDAGAE